MADKESQRRILVAKRNNLFEKMTLMLDVGKQLQKDESKIASFKARYAQIEDIYAKFEEYCERITLLDVVLTPEKEIDVQTFNAFEALYFEIQILASSVIKVEPPGPCTSQSSDPSHNSAHEPCSQPRLPNLEIPTWDSSLKTWPTFHDKFKALVHDNPSVKPVTKLHYLTQAVSGPALTLIQSLPITDGNYPIIWAMLIKKYQNKRVLGADMLERIIKCPSASTETISSLNTFIETFCDGVAALYSLDLPHLDDFIFLQMGLAKLPFSTRKQFEHQYLDTELPTCQQLFNFVENQAKIIEFSKSNDLPKVTANKPVKGKSGLTSYPNPSGSHFKTSFFSSATNNDSISRNHRSKFSRSVNSKSCLHCSREHVIYKCPEFLELSPTQRRTSIKGLRACFNCLKPSHLRNTCTSRGRCGVCSSEHHTLLHIEVDKRPPPAITTTVQRKEPDSNTNNSSLSTSLVISNKENSILTPDVLSLKPVILGTAVVSIQDSSGKFIPVRAMIDSCSQTSVISSACAKRLNLPVSSSNVTIAGLGQGLVQSTGLISCLIKPRKSDTPQFTTTAAIIEKFTSPMPSVKFSKHHLEFLSSLPLADPKFDSPGHIDFLIAADIYPYVYDGEKIHDAYSGLTAMSSIFGWVITGQMNCTSNVRLSSFHVCCEPSEQFLKKFWETEEPPAPSIENPDDISCEHIYKTLHYRLPDSGRYVVPLPFRDSRRPSSKSYALAFKRLISLERRFNQNGELRKQYQIFFDEYERLGHMSQVPLSGPDSDVYFISHHAVLNPNSSTTKLRVVFDGSASTPEFISLNKLLFIGPKLQTDIVAILIRFMLHVIVFTADVRQMYRQILIRPEDRRYQHIIWRKTPSSPLQEFELNTITYGLTPSPYLALRTLRQLAEDDGEKFPLAVSILTHDIYIDDVFSGGLTKLEAQERMSELRAILYKGGFELRKWSSNCPELLSEIPEDLRQTPVSFDSDGRELLKILGVQWDPVTDTFTYRTTPINGPCTKRSILSHIARIYDPLGWLSPVIFRLKCLMQHLWRLGLSWDDPVPKYIEEEWLLHCEQISVLSSISIPRYVLSPQYSDLKLVGYCDASERGYCGIVYLCVNLTAGVQQHLVLAKSKVAPLKTLSIPRLELCAAVLLAKLLKYSSEIFSNTPHSISEILAFSDSTTVLSWLKTPTYKLKTFVASRVNQVLELIPPEVWRHVSSELNPADCASRGLHPQQLVEHPLWWRGPPWLSRPYHEWPIKHTFLPLIDLPELKSSSTVNAFHQYLDFSNRASALPIDKVSSLFKLIRYVAWYYRLLHNLKLPAQARNFSPLSTQELDHAHSKIVREVQLDAFQEDVMLLANNKECRSVALRRLNPFLDTSGCLRVGGRLKHASLPERSIHPFILPSKGHFTNIVIDSYHIRYLHIGPRSLQSLLCRTYWILSVRNTIRSRLSKCNTCFRFHSTHLAPKMADLPAPRITPCSPFVNVGIDFGGPFSVKESKRRNAKVLKCYLCLFVCMSTKAVHLEIVSDLSSSAFLAAFDRFIARRGLCTNVYTDCGTNFVGARRYLNDLYQVLLMSKTSIAAHLSDMKINWVLNVPTASHMGGLWEAGIKSAKYHLKRILKDHVLTFEELSTLFTKVEAVLNSRPLCSSSPDPSEINVLTPGHFLIGRPLLAVPEPDLHETKLTRLDRWQFIQQATQHFWRRWSLEYLHTLQQRFKWTKSQDGIKVGDVVLIMNDQTAPLHWKLGRVETLHPGQDQIVRAATIRTPQGNLLRPLIKLCPLPTQ